VVVRKDLPFAQIAVQAIHAATISISEPVPENLHVVLCEARDERHIHKIINRLTRKGVNIYVFKEPDIDNQVTAFASQIVTDRRTFKNLRLLSKEH